jgi:hypothetical protein
MCSIVTNDNDWNVVCSKEENPLTSNEESTPKEQHTIQPDNQINEQTNQEIKENDELYIILVNNRPYGCYKDEKDTLEQLSQVQEYVRETHLYEFRKDYYWVEVPVDEYSDTILKMNLISNMKDIIVKYDYLEDTIEIVKSRLL